MLAIYRFGNIWLYSLHHHVHVVIRVFLKTQTETVSKINSVKRIFINLQAIIKEIK